MDNINESKTYVWCEDSSSGYLFWKKIFAVIHENFIVETKKNNSELRKAVTKIREDGNTYYIIIDSMYDNPDVLREVRAIKEQSAKKKNIFVLESYSFELILLSFKYLEKWIFSENDELKEKRSALLELKELFLDSVLFGISVEDQLLFFKKLEELHYISNDKKRNYEQLSSKLLLDITKNTGFETNKGKLGKCFYCDCCTWEERQEDDKCGLDGTRLSSIVKLKQLKEHTVISSIFQEVGL